jgi:hypothetical protein
MQKMLALSCVAILLFSSAMAQEVQTLKERLSDKASDAQRVDNCHVPPERRGAVPRPDCSQFDTRLQPAAPEPRARPAQSSNR